MNADHLLLTVPALEALKTWLGEQIMSQLVLTPKISEKAINMAERGVYIFEGRQAPTRSKLQKLSKLLSK